MRNRLLTLVEEQARKSGVPEFEIGDQVDIHQRILEGTKERIQVFSGTVIARRGGGMREMFTVRRIVQGEGVERVFPLHSPRIAKIEVKRTGAVRRAKLYYLRERVGKATRLRERKRGPGAADGTAGSGGKSKKAEREVVGRYYRIHGHPGVAPVIAPTGVAVAATSPKVPFWRRWFGSRSERAAGRFLQRLGYRLVVRNYSSPLGELDLVALDGRTIVFVEVRSTEGEDTGKPAASVDAEKQRRLTALALDFLQKHRLLGQPARFDVLAVSWPDDCKEPAIVHYPNAFEAVGRFQIYS